MAVMVDPRYFQFGNAFVGGMNQAQENQRRQQLTDIEQGQYGLQQRRNSMLEDQYMRGLEADKSAGLQKQQSREVYRRIFEEAGLDPGLADTEGADELAAHILENKINPEQPKLMKGPGGVMVPEVAGAQAYVEPQQPRAPGQLYQIVGPDGKPQFVPAESAVGQQPFLKSEKPEAVADPEGQAQDAQNVLAAIDNAKKLISWNTTGLVGQRLGEYGGTDAYDLRAALNTVKSSIGFDRLQRMREASKSGGALGAISERELDLLQSTIASIDANQTGPQLANSLDRVQAQYKKAMKAYQAAIAEKNGAAAPAVKQSGVVDFSELPD